MKESFGREPDRAWRDIPAAIRMPCLCGGSIEYRPGANESIPVVVARHNREQRHADWWAENEKSWHPWVMP